MYEIYKNENKENITNENNDLIKSKYGLLCSLDNTLNVERKIDFFFNNIQKVESFLDFKTLDEIYTLSSFVRKNIYTIQYYVLKNIIDYNNIQELINISLILNNIYRLQEVYIDFLYESCKSKSKEVFDIKKSKDYQSKITEEVKKLELKNN